MLSISGQRKFYMWDSMENVVYSFSFPSMRDCFTKFEGVDKAPASEARNCPCKHVHVHSNEDFDDLYSKFKNERYLKKS